jgi:hypothetical protein
MIKPVKVQAYPHCIFKEQKDWYTVFSLEDKLEAYNEFRRKRQESESKLIRGKMDEQREQHENMVSEEFNKIVGDYIEKLQFKKPKTRVLYGEDQSVYIQDGINYLLLNDENEEKRITLYADMEFRTQEELKGKLRLFRADKQQGYEDYFKILKKLFNSIQKKQTVAEPLILIEGIMEIHSPDYYQKTLDLMTYFFNKADKGCLNELTQIEKELYRNCLLSDFAKGLLEREYQKKFSILERDLSKIMKNVDILGYLKEK